MFKYWEMILKKNAGLECEYLCHAPQSLKMISPQEILKETFSSYRKVKVAGILEILMKDKHGLARDELDYSD